MMSEMFETTMTDEFRAQVEPIWRASFHLLDVDFDQPGSTIIAHDARKPGQFINLWPVGQRAVLYVAPAMSAEIRALAAAHPDRPLSGDDFVRAWGGDHVHREPMRVWLLDAAQFRPVTPPEPYTVRAFTGDDAAAFVAFTARCTPDERAEAEIAHDQGEAWGVFDGERVVAGASTFPWRGFEDIGVMTDPDYRGRGLGRAAVSAVCTTLLARDAIPVYRHDLRNRASQRVAQALGFAPFLTVDALRRVEG